MSPWLPPSISSPATTHYYDCRKYSIIVYLTFISSILKCRIEQRRQKQSHLLSMANQVDVYHVKAPEHGIIWLNLVSNEP